jgi:sugar phosphate isomerase/epimerase
MLYGKFHLKTGSNCSPIPAILYHKPMPHPFTNVTAQCFVNIPFERLVKDIKLFLENRIQPEIGLDGDALYTFSQREFFNVATLLHNEDIACTLHAPFTDLAPGGADHYIVHATRKKLRKAFDLLEIFQPRSIVCHLGYETIKHRNRVADWLCVSLETWQNLLEIAVHAQTKVMYENTYETEPSIHQRLLTELDSDQTGFCLDTGHLLAFAHCPWQDWLPAMHPWLGQLHLHDNQGHTDAHLAIGKGVFDFEGLFSYLKAEDLHPIITLEPHTEDDLWESLNALQKFNYFSSA